MSEKMSEKVKMTDRTIKGDLAKIKKMSIISREGGRKRRYMRYKGLGAWQN